MCLYSQLRTRYVMVLPGFASSLSSSLPSFILIISIIITRCGQSLPCLQFLYPGPLGMTRNSCAPKYRTTGFLLNQTSPLNCVLLDIQVNSFPASPQPSGFRTPKSYAEPCPRERLAPRPAKSRCDIETDGWVFRVAAVLSPVATGQGLH